MAGTGHSAHVSAAAPRKRENLAGFKGQVDAVENVFQAIGVADIAEIEQGFGHVRDFGFITPTAASARAARCSVRLILLGLSFRRCLRGHDHFSDADQEGYRHAASQR